MPSAFAKHPPLISSCLHILTTVPQIGVLDLSEMHFPFPLARGSLLPSMPVFEVLQLLKVTFLVIDPAQPIRVEFTSQSISTCDLWFNEVTFIYLFIILFFLGVEAIIYFHNQFSF